jgi:hypothetical protein
VDEGGNVGLRSHVRRNAHLRQIGLPQACFGENLTKVSGCQAMLPEAVEKSFIALPGGLHVLDRVVDVFTGQRLPMDRCLSVRPERS